MSDDTQSLARHGALGDLYARLLPALLAWARLRIRPDYRHVLLAEDLVQDVWLRASEVFDTFDPDSGSFRPWLFTVAKNVLYEAQRRAFRQAREAGPGGGTSRLLALERVPDDVTSLTQRVQRDEGIRLFLDHVSLLDEDDRRTLIHCGLEDLSLREAAERLDLTRDAVAKRWQRLRDRIRTWRIPEGLVAG